MNWNNSINIGLFLFSTFRRSVAERLPHGTSSQCKFTCQQGYVLKMKYICSAKQFLDSNDWTTWKLVSKTCGRFWCSGVFYCFVSCNLFYYLVSGWEQFTDAVITWLNKNLSGVVFMLWGSYAQKKGARIDKVNYPSLFLCSVDPSLNSHSGYKVVHLWPH